METEKTEIAAEKKEADDNRICTRNVTDHKRISSRKPQTNSQHQPDLITPTKNDTIKNNNGT